MNSLVRKQNCLVKFIKLKLGLAVLFIYAILLNLGYFSRRELIRAKEWRRWFMRDSSFKDKNKGEWTYGDVKAGMDKARAPEIAFWVLGSEAQL